jgi:hypothetical protein
MSSILSLDGMNVEHISVFLFYLLNPGRYVQNKNEIFSLNTILYLNTEIEINGVIVTVSVDRERREMLFIASFEEGQSSVCFEELVAFYRRRCDCYREGNRLAA